jgi:hypothetical protein
MPSMNVAAEVLVVCLSVASAVAFFALMVWAARADGRGQRPYERLVRRYRDDDGRKK